MNIAFFKDQGALLVVFYAYMHMYQENICVKWNELELNNEEVLQCRTQSNGTEKKVSSNNHPNYTQLIFDEGAMNTQGEKETLFSKQCGENLDNNVKN